MLQHQYVDTDWLITNEIEICLLKPFCCFGISDLIWDLEFQDSRFWCEIRFNIWDLAWRFKSPVKKIWDFREISFEICPSLVERRRTATAIGLYDSFCHIFFFLHSFSLHLFVSPKSLNDEERGGNCLLVPQRRAWLLALPVLYSLSNCRIFYKMSCPCNALMAKRNEPMKLRPYGDIEIRWREYA